MEKSFAGGVTALPQPDVLCAVSSYFRRYARSGKTTFPSSVRVPGGILMDVPEMDRGGQRSDLLPLQNATSWCDDDMVERDDKNRDNDS